jgi:hypothetical protein
MGKKQTFKCFVCKKQCAHNSHLPAYYKVFADSFEIDKVNCRMCHPCTIENDKEHHNSCMIAIFLIIGLIIFLLFINAKTIPNNYDLVTSNSTASFNPLI